MFQQQLEAYIGVLNDLCRRGASEDSIRDAFLTFLRNVFPRLSLSDSIELEKHIPALRVRGGFADALYGDLVFEFKKVLSDASRVEGIEELTRYIRNQRHPDRFLGLLTDGRCVEAYALRGDNLAKVDELVLAEDRADHVQLWLDCYLFHEKNLTPTANDVALRFGDRSPTYWRGARILESLWTAASDEPSAQTKFIEWQGLLSIVYGSSVGDVGLFMRHTYLALFARVLAFVAIQRRAPADGELRGILDGRAFEEMGFENFVGDDFFTWMAHSSSREEGRTFLRALGTRLAHGYNLAEIHEDLLKELYQELVDPQTRHDLGEFYTPDWLAEMTLRRAGFPNPPSSGVEPSLCDPTCGSGTFLFTAIRLLRESGLKGAMLVRFCAQNIAGMDVHPLAVTIAKTNLLLALGDELKLHKGRFAIPVFMADSLNVVNHSESTVGSEIEIPVDVGRIETEVSKPRPKGLPSGFGIPTALANQPELLHESLDTLLQFAQPQQDDAAAKAGLKLRLEELGIPGTQEHLWLTNLELMRWLLSPPPTNSVWRFILQNACQPQLLALRRFTFVVGNPPWLSYRYIQRQDYQKRIRNLVREYALIASKQTHLVTQMELATLFFAFCADWYLSEGGILAFVMPRSVLTQAKQHQAFRKRYVESCALLIDCERVEPLFNVPTCVLVWRKGDARSADGSGDYASPAASKVALAGLLPLRNATLAEAQIHLTMSEGPHGPITSGEPSPYLQEVTQGASIVPRCLWFVQPPPTAKIVDDDRPHLITDASTKRQAKAPWKGLELRGSVESEFLFATLLSDNMVPFGWRRLSVVVLPLAEHPDGTRFLLKREKALSTGKSGLCDWLGNADETWRLHRKSQEELLDYINWQNKLVRQKPAGVVKLLYNTSGTHICACVMDIRQSIEARDCRLPVKGFVADTTTYWYETQEIDEAHYLCAFLNAACVDSAIKPHQPKGLFGAAKGGGQRHIHRRPFEVVPIPRYSPRDPGHRELARLSRLCHKTVAKGLAGFDEQLLTSPIGRLRTKLRYDVLRGELSRIDASAGEILGAQEKPE